MAHSDQWLPSERAESNTNENTRRSTKQTRMVDWSQKKNPVWITVLRDGRLSVPPDLAQLITEWARRGRISVFNDQIDERILIGPPDLDDQLSGCDYLDERKLERYGQSSDSGVRVGLPAATTDRLGNLQDVDELVAWVIPASDETPSYIALVREDAIRIR